VNSFGKGTVTQEMRVYFVHYKQLTGNWRDKILTSKMNMPSTVAYFEVLFPIIGSCRGQKNKKKLANALFLPHQNYF
jgi:hypothetical protein